MIFTTVGSRDYPYDRLFIKLDELYDQGILTEEMFAQIGSTKYRPRNFEFENYISPDEFMEKIQEADIILSHGASGSIMKALRAEKKIIGVSRLKKYGEHLNDHQVECNEAFANNNLIIMADPELSDLEDCFQKIYEHKDNLRLWVNEDPLAIVNLIDQFIQDHWK